MDRVRSAEVGPAWARLRRHGHAVVRRAANCRVTITVTRGHSYCYDQDPPFRNAAHGSTGEKPFLSARTAIGVSRVARSSPRCPATTWGANESSTSPFSGHG